MLSKSAVPLRSRRRWSCSLLIEALESRILLTTLPSGFSETVVATGLGSPTAMDVLPDGRILVNTQTGDLRIIDGGVLQPTAFLHLTVDSNGERGLLGVTHDPNFATNHFIYVYHTVPANGATPPFNQVSRFTANGDVALAGSEVDILNLNSLSSATNHNGGALHFGTDKLLYISVGENANAANSQTLGNLLGKILRIDVSTVAPGDPVNNVAKLIPPTNPFNGTAIGINQGIYALGLRNPYTFAVQPGTGTIYVNDVGENTWEEINLLVAGSNYGWNKSEGFANPNPPTGLGPGTYRDPLLAYNHTGGPAGGGIAIVGGIFYNPAPGAVSPFPSSYTGKYFYQDLGGNWIRLFDRSTPGSLATPDTAAGFATGTTVNPVDLALAPDGGLYYLARGSTGQLMKISFTNTIPLITGVYLSSSSWSQTFLNYLASTGKGSSTLGYIASTGLNQLKSLPWATLNQLSITFSENVTVSQAALSLTGLNVPSYSFSNFSYNSTTHTATWTLAAPIKADTLTLTILAASVTDSSSNQLDGEWTDNVSTHSGNSAAGGDFHFHLNVLPGDINQSGLVNGADFDIWFTHLSTNTFDFAQGDLNADGLVDGADFDVWFSHLQQSLSTPSANTVQTYSPPLTATTTSTILDDSTTTSSKARHLKSRIKISLPTVLNFKRGLNWAAGEILKG